MDKSGKRNRFLDALAGRNVQEEPEKFPEIPLKDMVQTLEGVTEEAWGRYAFAREPLERKFTSQEKDAYTVKANACGREWAKRISEKYGTEDPKILAGKMGMKVKMPKVPTGGGVVLFAQYVQPDEITIFTDCVDKAAALEKQCGCPLLKKERLLEILLAHELFHAVEEQYAGEIFTRTEKIELWRKPFSNRSVISCLSEIAAMAFARQLSGLSVSPYMLDVLLVYSYDKNTSYGLYDEIWKWNREVLSDKKMLTTNILLAEKYDYLSEKFKKAFTFLRDTDLAALPVGNVPIDGNEVYANVQSYSTMDAADCPFESHKEYFDVQYVVEGEECFGYEPVENLIPSVEYDAEKDLIFYQEPADFAIVPPEDGHAPRRMTANGSCHVKKIVVKVRV